MDLSPFLSTHHEFDYDDGFYTCRHCKRVSANTDALKSTACVTRVIDPGVVLSRPVAKGDEIEVQATRAVAEAELAQHRTPQREALYVQLENEIKAKAKKEDLTVVGITRHGPVEMTTMTGYWVVKVTAIVKGEEGVEIVNFAITVEEVNAFSKFAGTYGGPQMVGYLAQRYIESNAKEQLRKVERIISMTWETTDHVHYITAKVKYGQLSPTTK